LELRVFLNTKNIEIIHDSIENFSKQVHTVIQNPPFGTKKIHADTLFLKKAFSIAKVIYSLHKSSTTNFILSLAEENNFNATIIKEYDFPLKHTMKHHTKPKQNIKVSLIKFKKNS